MANKQTSYSKRGWSIVTWVTNHQKTAIDSLQQLIRQPVQSSMTVIVIAIAIVLPALLLVMTRTVGDVGQQLQQGNPISLYLVYETNDKAVNRLKQWLGSHQSIESIQVISASEGLKHFERWSGLGQVLESLDRNPLPAVIIVQPNVDLGVEQLKDLESELSKQPLIDQAQLDLDWVARLQVISELFERVVWSFSLLLALGVLLVIGNTIRLSIENRRDEIVIVKLVGATNAFVRRPFLYTGLWYGLAGGLLSVIMSLIALLWLQMPLGELAGLYGASQQFLQGFGFIGNLSIILGAGLLGLLGARVAVGRLTTSPAFNTNSGLYMRRIKSISWVAMSSVTPKALNWLNSSIILADSSGSRLPVGSSANKILGLCTTALAMPTRCCSPPDRVSGILLALLSNPTLSSTA